MENETLNFGPGAFEEMKKDPNFIAIYGCMPAFGGLEEIKKWLDMLDKISSEVNLNYEQEMSKYFYPEGPIIGYGYTYKGIIEVTVNREVRKPFMDEIYQIFNSKASLMGVKGVPVVFFREDIAMPVTG